MTDGSLTKQRALLLILLATCDRALEAFHAADNVIDREFVADLERIGDRTRGEIEALTAAIDAEG